MPELKAANGGFGMKTNDLPESENVEDRRGEKPAQTLAEMAEQAKTRKVGPIGPSGAEDSDLAKSLGKDDIAPKA